MEKEKRVAAFVKLGKKINSFTAEQLKEYAQRAGKENPWFTEEFVTHAFEGVAYYLKGEAPVEWTAHYGLNPSIPKKVGVIAAGNIPMVGFHDILSVLISGHDLRIKLSSKDTVLMKEVLRLLIQIEPEFEEKIYIRENLKNIDAVIATGSDTSSRYFDYYFSSVPHIIRKNRTSVAVLDGSEDGDDLRHLKNDIFLYFGLGCRNVSKIYVPADYEFETLLNALSRFDTVSQHQKYLNNYTYNKTLLLMNGENFYDNGILLAKSSEELFSPVSVLFYEKYDDKADLEQKVAAYSGKIQCIASKNAVFPDSTPFGTSQRPSLNDYADNIDTLNFLEGL